MELREQCGVVRAEAPYPSTHRYHPLCERDHEWEFHTEATVRHMYYTTHGRYLPVPIGNNTGKFISPITYRFLVRVMSCAVLKKINSNSVETCASSPDCGVWAVDLGVFSH